MANITVNIEGDLNIFVSGENGQPECLYLDGSRGCPVGSMEIQFGECAEDGYDEGKAEVLYAVPGKTAVRMALYEALKLAMDNGGVDSVELLPTYDLLIAFNSDDVVSDDKGNLYLTGPGIVFNVLAGDVVSLNGDDEHMAKRILEMGTAKLSNGKETAFAFGL